MGSRWFLERGRGNLTSTSGLSPSPHQGKLRCIFGNWIVSFAFSIVGEKSTMSATDRSVTLVKESGWFTVNNRLMIYGWTISFGVFMTVVIKMSIWGKWRRKCCRGGWIVEIGRWTVEKRLKGDEGLGFEGFWEGWCWRWWRRFPDGVRGSI